MKIIIVPGYGIPKNPLKDDHYNSYLGLVFNYVFSLARDRKVTIIFSGGKTDSYEPYKRSEAGELAKVFKKIISDRPIPRGVTKDWKLLPESKSLSTLENLLNCKKIIKSKRLNQSGLVVFCEQTREQRMTMLVKKVFAGKVKVVPMDFNTSKSRYLPEKEIRQREDKNLKVDLWALKSAANLKRYHQAYVERFAKWRESHSKKHQEEVKKWWDKKLDELAG